METEIFTCKYFKFGRNTTGLSQSHLRNFLACSIIQVIGISKKRAFKILGLMGFKPMTISQNIFHLKKYQRIEPSKISALMGCKPMTVSPKDRALKIQTSMEFKSMTHSLAHARYASWQVGQHQR